MVKKDNHLPLLIQMIWDFYLELGVQTRLHY